MEKYVTILPGSASLAGGSLSWRAWLDDLKEFQEHAKVLPPVKYPPLKCKYCGYAVPEHVLHGRTIDVEIWASYHLKHHKNAVKELAAARLPWSAGLVPI
jgi:hypothetical protein